MTDEPTVRGIDTQVRLARAVIENLRPADLAAELDGGALALVDVREPDEVITGMILGAICVPRGLIEFVANVGGRAGRWPLDPARRTVVYSGDGSRSALVVRTLYALGYRDVAHLDGGLAAWVADGRPLTAPSVSR